MITAFSASPSNAAATVRTHVPALVGEWFVGESSGPIQIDFGTAFEQITEVSILLEGYSTFQLETVCFSPGACSELRNPTHASIVVGTFPNRFSVGVFLPGAPGAIGKATQWAAFLRLDFLLPGVTTLLFQPVVPAQIGSPVVQPGSLVLTDAVIEVIGTPVPEPGSSLLVAMGLTLLSLRGSRRITA